MKYRVSKLPNGLRVITVPIKSMESATVTVWVGTGSRNESKSINGLSHFLEHMVFKGSKKRPSAKEIGEAIDSFGGEFNASTHKEWTNFYIRTRTAKLETAIDVLSDMVLRPLLKKEDVEREKGVIVEEIAMYEDTPMANIGDIFENLIFKGSSLERDIAGTKKSVMSIKQSDFVKYRNKHYGGNNLVVTIAGGINEKKTLDLCRKYFSGLKRKKNVTSSSAKVSQKKPNVLLKSKKIEQAHFIMGFLGYKRNHKDKYAEGVLSTILGGGMSSRMFTEVREKRGLAYAVRTSPEHYLDTGYLSTYAGVDLKRVDDAVKVVLEQYYLLRDEKEKISKKELTKAKEYLKGHFALSLEDTKAINSLFGIGELLLNRIETPEEIFKGIEKVRVEDIIKVAKYLFVPEKLNFAIIGPYKSKERFVRLL